MIRDVLEGRTSAGVDVISSKLWPATEDESKRLDLVVGVLDRLPVGVALLRPVDGAVDFEYIYANRVHEALKPGIPVVGRTYGELWPELADFALPHFREVFETGEPWAAENAPLEVEIERGRPETRYYTFELSLLVIEGTRVLLDRSIETTTEVEALGALRASEERFRGLITATNDALFRMSPDWSVLRQLQGQTFLASTEVDDPEWLHRYVPQVDREYVLAAIGEAVANRSVFELEHRVYQADGRVGWTRTRAVPLLADDGDIAEWFGFASDITERKLAEARARHEYELIRTLLQAADAIAEPLELPELLDVIARVVVQAVDHGRSWVFLWAEAAGEAVLSASAGSAALPVGTAFPFHALSAEMQRVIIERRTRVVDYGALTTRRRDPTESLGSHVSLIVPLIQKGRLVGVLGIDDPVESREFSAREIEIVEGIAPQAALAIENAKLFEAERNRTRFARSLAEINADLASSLDIDETMPGVFEKVRAELGAYAAGVVDRIEGGWQIRVLVGVDPKVFKPGYVFKDRLAPTLMRMLHSREPEVVSNIRHSGIANLVVATLAGYEAYAGYPLLVRGEVVGALGVFFNEPRTLSDIEIDYCRRFGFAVSLAEENSRLYKAEHRIAETLQTALLALPDHMNGIEYAHYYASATETARVGGDFYDLFELEHDMIGMTVGDIAGHGIDAAVLTSLVKNAIRVQATEQRGTPNEVMQKASRLLLANSPTTVFATVFFGVLHLDDGVLEYCNAGHTTGACLCSADGITKLPSNSPLIGALPGQEYKLSQVRLTARETIFLYTDGVTEARRGREMFGEERVFELVASSRGHAPGSIVQNVVDSVLAFAGGELSDDVAILAVRRA